VVKEVPTVPSGMAFTLSILGKTINVATNVEATLEKNPGWLPTSAQPGEKASVSYMGIGIGIIFSS